MRSPVMPRDKRGIQYPGRPDAIPIDAAYWIARSMPGDDGRREQRSNSDIPAEDTMPAPPKPKRPARRASPPRKPYHHGDLRRVLVDAALDLAAQSGAEQVSVREAARRAGVSPGAPFRHFPSREALLTAVAEEAQRRFRAEIETALATAPDEPLAQFRSLGLAYLRWAM